MGPVSFNVPRLINGLSFDEEQNIEISADDMLRFEAPTMTGNRAEVEGQGCAWVLRFQL